MKNNMRKVLIVAILLGVLVLSVNQTGAKWEITDPDTMLKSAWVYHDVGDLLQPQTQDNTMIQTENFGIERIGKEAINNAGDWLIGEFTPTNPGDDSGDSVKNKWKAEQERLHEYYDRQAAKIRI